MRRGTAAQQILLLERLRPLLRAPSDPENMLRSVARLLASEIGEYAIADVVDPAHGYKRIEIAHADASLRARLRVASADANIKAAPRIARVCRAGAGELVARVTPTSRARVTDLVLPDGADVRSYVSGLVSVFGAPWAVLSLVATNGALRYGESDLSFLGGVADWCGVGLENALRRELEGGMDRASPFPEERTSIMLRSGA
jgi:hypothetical protein